MNRSSARPPTNRRDDHHRARRVRNLGEIEPREAARRHEAGDQPLKKLNRQLARRHDRQQNDDHQHRPLPAASVSVGDGRRDHRRRAHSDRAQVARRRVPEGCAPEADRDSRLPSDAVFERPPAGADQVVADVRFARLRRPFRDLPCAFDAFQRHAHLPVAGRFRDLFDRMPVAIAAGEVHARIHTGGIALQDLLDQTDALEELAPVERRDEAEAPDQVGHERLLARLMPRFRTNRVLHRLAARAQRSIELAPEIRRARMLPGALEQSNHERRMHLRRPGLPDAGGRLQRVDQSIRIETMGAARGEDVSPDSQVFDERQLQRGRPRPELAHRERTDRLICRDEAVHALRVEPARTAPDQLEGHRINPGQARKLVGRDPRKPPEEGRGQVVMNIAKSRQNDVKIVEQPLGGR